MVASFDAPSVAQFLDVFIDNQYAPLPADAWIAVTDVVASTKAIAAGRYKAVNLAGAASIAALSNAAPTWDLPFAFGGDGAVVVVPHHLRDIANLTLKGLHRSAQHALSLTLRTAMFPLAELRKRGTDVALLYHALKGGRRLAMLSGGGITMAETLAKSAEGQPFIVAPDENAPDPSLDGLSCRWQPIKPQRGIMLSVVVEGGGPPSSYLPVFKSIAAAAAGPKNPLSHRPRMAWPPTGLAAETKLQSGLSPWRYQAGVLVQSALGTISTATGLRIGGFDGRHYQDSLDVHCDALKFADSLKMVIDCTPAEADAVEKTLLRMATGSGFRFGLLRSSAALMTCFVQTTTDGGHVHFIDGSDGGYALAARAMKDRNAKVAQADIY